MTDSLRDTAPAPGCSDFPRRARRGDPGGFTQADPRAEHDTALGGAGPGRTSVAPSLLAAAGLALSTLIAASALTISVAKAAFDLVPH